jgi:Replicative DNA helicase
LTEGKAELIIAKHRNGETGSAFVDFDSHNARFVDTRDLVDHNYEGNENEKKSNSDQKRAAYANPPISEEEQGEETHDIQSRSNDELEYGDDREQPAF